MPDMTEALSKSNDPILFLNIDGNIEEANPAAEVLAGKKKKKKQQFWEYLPLEDSEQVARIFDHFLNNQLDQSDFQMNLKAGDGLLTFDCSLQKVQNGVVLHCHDVTKFVAATNELASHKDFKLIFQNARELIVLHNLDGSYKFISDSVYDLTGYEPEELLGKSPYLIIHPDDLEPIFEEPYRQKLLEEPIANEEYRIIRKDGTTTWFESYTKPLYDQEQLIGFQSSSREITERKRDEDKYRKVNEKLSQYREGLKLLSEITANADLSVSMQIQEALGVTTEFFGMNTGILSSIDNNVYKIENVYTFADLRSGEEYKLGDTYAEIVYRKNEIVAIENMAKSRFRTHPGYEIFKLESYIGIPYFVSGKLRGTIDFYSDKPRNEAFDVNELEFLKLLARWIGFILQQHEYEKNLMADKIMLQAFVSSAPAAIAMFDTDFQYLAASDKWYTDYDLEDEFIIGRSHFEVFPDNGQDWEKIFRSAIKGNVESNDEDLLEKNDGEIKWIKWEVRPWFKKLDTVGGLIMHTEDITHQKEQQLQLKIAKRKAEQASKAKEQFLSTMSHEIRTPLNAILGMTEIMLMDETDDEKLRHLKLLQFSGKNLLALINDILDFNKIEAGKLELEQIDFNLKELFERIRDSLENLASRKGLEFQLKYDDDLPLFFKGDAIRLGQVITNLANNAIKFTEEGYIAIKARHIHTMDGVCRLKVEVKDTGIGIPKTKVEKIFKSFEQASSDVSRKYGGSGLGLSITKKILQVMSTDIEVNSSEGLGSIFFFELELPLGESVESSTDHHHAAGDIREDLKLLVAEDNPGNRILIESLFKRWELNFDFAFNGREAYEKVQTKIYDIVLMDLQMPEMDGYTATKEIRKLKDPYYAKLPIVALTASVMSNVLEKTKKVGMNDYVSKPFDPTNLRNTIIKLTDRFNKQDYGGEEEKVELQEEQPVNGQHSDNGAGSNDFPYIRELVGDDNDALYEIVNTSLESVENAAEGVKEGLENSDIAKIRSELHVLRPNLHNLELGDLVDDLPKITDLTDENEKVLNQLVAEINQQLSTEKFKPFRK